MVEERFLQDLTYAVVAAVVAVAAAVAVVAEKIATVSLASSYSCSESTPLLTRYESLGSVSCGLRLNDSDASSAIPQVSLWARWNRARLTT